MRESYNTDHDRLVRIESDLESIGTKVDALYTAFMLDDLGKPSFESHRQYHLRQVKKAQEFDSIKLDVTKRIVQAIGTVLGIGLWAGVMYWMQQNFAK